MVLQYFHNSQALNLPFNSTLVIHSASDSQYSPICLYEYLTAVHKVDRSIH